MNSNWVPPYIPEGTFYEDSEIKELQTYLRSHVDF